jgi:hypothetical protein
MPCYDPPPEWLGAARASAEEAARILCATISDMLDQEIVGIPKGMLEWYLGHRRIDLMRLDDPRCMEFGAHRQTILDDIARVEALVNAR